MIRALLLNRVTVTLALIGAAALALNVYVAFHDDGILVGTVVGPDGTPVPGATVTLFAPGIVGFDVVERQQTGPDGRFRFAGHDQHHPALEARAEGLGSGVVRLRLYFRNQNRVLAEPLRLVPEEE